MRRYFVWELVLSGPGVLRLVALRTHLMFADALTKSLPGPAHIQQWTNIEASCLALRRLDLMILSPPVCSTLKLLLLLSFLSLLFCILPNSCGFTPLFCKGGMIIIQGTL